MGQIDFGPWPSGGAGRHANVTGGTGTYWGTAGADDGTIYFDGTLIK